MSISTDGKLTAAEESMMKMSFEVCMTRAADIIERITQADVEEVQLLLLGSGCSLTQVGKVDRCMLAAAHLRACARGIANDESKRVPAITGYLRGRVRS